jgi:predicted peptidase
VRIFKIFVLSLALLSTIAPRARAANPAEFTDFSLRSGATTLLPGRLYVPPESVADPTTDRPFIVFLHGGGEAGSNNTAQVNANIDNLLAEAKRRGAFLYAPQSPGAWSTTSLTANVMTMVDRGLTEFPVNKNKLYITGLSNGGGGTWNMLSRYPDRFAAAVPICGVTPASDFTPARLVDIPIAAFHARNDTVVSANVSRTTYNRILTAAGETLPTYPTLANAPDFAHSAASHDLSYVEFALGGHGIWTPVYNSPPLYNWLFSHALPEPSGAGIAWLSLAFIACRRRKH